MPDTPPVPVDLDLLEQIHDVSLGRASWDEVLACLTTEFSTEASLLVVYGARPEQARNLSMDAREGRDGRSWSQYAEHFAAIDPFVAAMGTDKFPAGLIVTGDMVVPPKAFCASEYYNDWFRPNGLRHTAGAFTPTADGCLLQLGVPRAPAAGPYSADEVARLQRYFNHIRRAIQVQEEIRARGAAPDYDQVARAYGLTPAEAKLVERLTESGSLRHSAERTHRSYYTLRAQLRSVFAKTGTRNQIELMRLIHQTRRGTPDAAGHRSHDR